MDYDDSDIYHFDRVENMNLWFTKTCTSLLRISAIPIKNLNRYKKIFDYHLMYEVLKNGSGTYLKQHTSVYRVHDTGKWGNEITSRKI